MEPENENKKMARRKHQGVEKKMQYCACKGFTCSLSQVAHHKHPPHLQAKVPAIGAIRLTNLLGDLLLHTVTQARSRGKLDLQQPLGSNCTWPGCMLSVGAQS